jgi:cell division protein FtsL
VPNVSHRVSSPPAAGPAPTHATCSTPRFFAYWLLALAAAVAAFSSHIYIRHRVVELGYALGQERSHRSRMENERRDLELELAAMEAPGDLAQVSRDVLGLDVPRDEQLLAVGTAAEAAAPDAPAAPAVVVRPPPDARPPEPAAEPLAPTGATDELPLQEALP